MKRSLKLTAVSLVALAMAGGLSGTLLAGTDVHKAAPGATEQQGPDAADAAEEAALSDHGMAAINDIQLARLAINDGYTDNAVKLLQDAKSLLKQVDDENVPVTVSTEVKVGDKPPQTKTVTEKPDLIPILSEIGFIEGVAQTSVKGEPASAQHAGKQPAEQTASAQPAAAGPEAQGNAETAHPSRTARMAAAEKARKQWRSGDRQAAMETLKPVELGLITRVVSMPLKETSNDLNQAISLLEKGKYHEANLALKAVEDGLIVSTDVVMEPAAKVAAADTGKGSGDKAQ